MSAGARMSHKAMERHGWTPRLRRLDGAKVIAWRHRDGWRLEHCGHPTALYPWALYSPGGFMVLTGARAGKPMTGTAWRTLAEAVAWVATARHVNVDGPGIIEQRARELGAFADGYVHGFMRSAARCADPDESMREAAILRPAYSQRELECWLSGAEDGRARSLFRLRLMLS